MMLQKAWPWALAFLLVLAIAVGGLMQVTLNGE
jgi:hypothetical protein